jgi:DNA-binding response OmpR family regulator
MEPPDRDVVATILLVDDEKDLVDCIVGILRNEGYHVVTARDGIEALAVLRSQPVDLIISDIMMPRMNGYELYQRVTENLDWVLIPFVFLTARAMDSDIRYGKELGSDDYLTKPFLYDDLMAIVRGRLQRARRLASAVGARNRREPADSDVVDLGRLRIECSQYRVWWDDRLVRLSTTEFKLLTLLARRANKVVSSEELIKHAHGLDTDSKEAGDLLRPLIRSVRRKLGYDAGDMGIIESVRSVGYRLVLPMREPDESPDERVD